MEILRYCAKEIRKSLISLLIMERSKKGKTLSRISFSKPAMSSLSPELGNETPRKFIIYGAISGFKLPRKQPNANDIEKLPGFGKR